MEKEKPWMSTLYKGHALAEQHSLDAAWEYFMLPKNKELRNVIYANEEEMSRFRQLVVNITIATDSKFYDSRFLPMQEKFVPLRRKFILTIPHACFLC